MPETQNAWSVAAVVAALRACRWITACSLFFTAAAAFSWTPLAGWLHVTLATTVLACGLGAIWYSFRIAIDEGLFYHLLDQTDAALPRLDEGLENIGWIKPEQKGRTWVARIEGAMQLVRRLIGLTMAQSFLWIAIWLTTPPTLH